jgi:hypothetical protein
MIPRNSDLLDYRSAIYSGKNMPLETQLFFVENALRAEGVIAGGPELPEDSEEGTEAVPPVRYRDEIQSALYECESAASDCERAASALRELLRSMRVKK